MRTAQEEQADRDRRVAAPRHRLADGARASRRSPARRRPGGGSRWSAPDRPGLACAHRLARHGHDVTVFEARPKPGGLNEYGIAAYKVADDFAQREVGFHPGDRRHHHRATARRSAATSRCDVLRRDFDAVFLGLGQAGVKRSALAGEALAGVRDAVDFIAELRQAPTRIAWRSGAASW